MGWVRRNGRVLCILFDVAVLGVFFYLIPWMRRPLEFLFATAGVLALITVIAAGRGGLRNFSVTVFVLCWTLFGLEMVQRKWNITEIFEPEPEVRVGVPNEYAWSARQSPTYLAARERAKKELGDPEAFTDVFAGDVFKDRDKGGLWERRSKGGSKEDVTVALRHPYLEGPPLGFELTSDNLIRHYCLDRESGTMLWDGSSTINGAGFRETRGNPDADEAFLFLGCSVTYGYGLSDDQTTAYQFNAGYGFEKRALNFAVSNYGTHHALRELELNYHGQRAGLDASRVRGVYYGLIDDHPNRVVKPASPSTPRYRMENGRAVYAGTYTDSPVLGRLAIMMDRSRIYPALRDKFLRKEAGGTDAYKWQLTYAILKEMDRICRERYGVGLTVIYWGNISGVPEKIRAEGIEVVPVGDAFGEDWERVAIKFSLADGHPNAYANRLLGQYLWRLRETGGDQTITN